MMSDATITLYRYESWGLEEGICHGFRGLFFDREVAVGVLGSQVPDILVNPSASHTRVYFVDVDCHANS